MTTAVLDQLLTLALEMLSGAHAAMLPMGFGLLGATAIIEFYVGLLFASLDGYVNVNRLIGVAILIIIQVCLSVYVMLNLPAISQAFWDTFLTFATAATGSGGTITQLFSQPSELWETGFRLTKGMINYLGWPQDMLVFHVAGWIIQLAFMVISFCALMARIEFAVLVPLAVVLMALGVLSPFGFLLAGIIRGLAAVLIRVFTLAIVVTLAVISMAPWTSTGLPDPDQASAAVLLSLSIGFAVLAWFLPSVIVGATVGAGSGLGMGSLMALGAVGASTVSMGLGVVRGVSSLVRELRQ